MDIPTGIKNNKSYPWQQANVTTKKDTNLQFQFWPDLNTTTSSNSWIQNWWTWQLSLEQLHIEWQKIVHYNFMGDAKEYLLNKI